MDKKTKNRLVVAARQISVYWKPRLDAKNARKVAPATFQCEHCQHYIYEGKHSIEYIVTVPQYIAVKGLIRRGKTVRESKIAMDHINPVVPVDGFTSGLEFDWNEYYKNVFCDASGYQALCKECHTIKSSAENQLRRESKRKREKKATHGTVRKKARKTTRPKPS